ncbi:hypothetical protein NFI96_016922, partial [Prochilodus magdalenae]
MMRPCVSPALCRSEQNLLRQICGSEDGRCELQGPERCNATVQTILAHSPLWRECACSDEDSCSALQLLASLCLSYLAGDEALHAAEEFGVAAQQESSQITAREDQALKPEWKASSLLGYVPGPNSSCLQEMALCIQDEVCNKQLVPFVQSCTEPECEESRCRLATRRFFSGVPQSVAEMLVFCQCEQADQDCQDIRNTLHSSSCSGGDTLPWNCMEMLDSCAGDQLCRLARPPQDHHRAGMMWVVDHSQHCSDTDVVVRIIHEPELSSSTASFGQRPVGKRPLGKGPLGKGPLGKGPVGKRPLGKSPLGKSPLGKGPLGKGPVGKGPVGKRPLGKSPLGKSPLGKRPLGKPSCGEASFGQASFRQCLLGKRPLGKSPLGKRSLGSVLWASVLWASVLRASILWAPSCGQHPLRNHPLGKHPVGIVMWASVVGVVNFGDDYFNP